MPHKIEISDKTFEKLKEYCQLNGLKIGQQADKLIYDGLMLEMYGDVPFTNYRIKPQQEVPSVAVKGTLNEDGTFEQEMVEKAVDEHLSDVVGFKWEGAGGPDVILTRRELPEMRAFQKKIDEMAENVVSDRRAVLEKIVEMTPGNKETLKGSGVPDKVINRITKRRLK